MTLTLISLKAIGERYGIPRSTLQKFLKAKRIPQPVAIYQNVFYYTEQQATHIHIVWNERAKSKSHDMKAVYKKRRLAKELEQTQG